MNDQILLPGGNKAIFRNALDQIPSGCRVATPEELYLANAGYEFPWGKNPSPEKTSRLWKSGRIGMGGLVHNCWFKTTEGRFGGAANVPLTVPATLRYSLLIGGGECPDQKPEPNEGWAVIRDLAGSERERNQQMRRQVQVYASEHVAADGGSIIVSPIASDGVIYVGFVSRCMFCPNAEMISFRALAAALPKYTFRLFPEWEFWQV